MGFLLVFLIFIFIFSRRRTTIAAFVIVVSVLIGCHCVPILHWRSADAAGGAAPHRDVHDLHADAVEGGGVHRVAVMIISITTSFVMYVGELSTERTFEIITELVKQAIFNVWLLVDELIATQMRCNFARQAAARRTSCSSSSRSARTASPRTRCPRRSSARSPRATRSSACTRTRRCSGRRRLHRPLGDVRTRQGRAARPLAPPRRRPAAAPARSPSPRRAGALDPVGHLRRLRPAVRRHAVDKIKTIGDAYIVRAGALDNDAEQLPTVSEARALRRWRSAWWMGWRCRR